MTDRPFILAAKIAAIILMLTIASFMMLLTLEGVRQMCCAYEPEINTAELTGWFKLEGRN